MLPPAEAIVPASLATMPSRSAPCTVTRYVEPTGCLSDSSGTARTVTASEGSIAAASARSTSAAGVRPAQIKVMAK
jgi:hypothetical protein